MRAAARKARAAIRLASKRQDEDSGDESDLSGSHDNEADEGQNDCLDLDAFQVVRNVSSFDSSSSAFRTRREDSKSARGSIAKRSGHDFRDIPIRTAAENDLVMAGHRGSNGAARQNVRDTIVQQWDHPSRSNGASRTTNGSSAENGNYSAAHGSGAPLTPPMNDEDERELMRRDLEEKIMRNVEENGIERPRWSVSNHYNR